MPHDTHNAAGTRVLRLGSSQAHRSVVRTEVFSLGLWHGGCGVCAPDVLRGTRGSKWLLMTCFGGLELLAAGLAPSEMRLLVAMQRCGGRSETLPDVPQRLSCHECDVNDWSLEMLADTTATRHTLCPRTQLTIEPQHADLSPSPASQINVDVHHGFSFYRCVICCNAPVPHVFFRVCNFLYSGFILPAGTP